MIFVDRRLMVFGSPSIRPLQPLATSAQFSLLAIPMDVMTAIYLGPSTYVHTSSYIRTPYDVLYSY